MTDVPLYDNLSSNYDIFISWEARLQREGPFLKKLFEENGVRSVLDTACGTGMHALLFAKWGLKVVGTDLSAEMIKQAELNKKDYDLRFFQAGFTELTEFFPEPFDAVTCLGNSLPHVANEDELLVSLANMYAVLKPGGVIVLHNNNYDRILGKKERFMRLISKERDGKEFLFVRFFDFNDFSLSFNIVTLVKTEGKWDYHVESTKQYPLLRRDLESALIQEGFCKLEFYGSFDGGPFDELSSENLVVVARRNEVKSKA